MADDYTLPARFAALAAAVARDATQAELAAWTAGGHSGGGG
jgi:hypothetical protein